jgi:hypothetical protein
MNLRISRRQLLRMLAGYVSTVGLTSRCDAADQHWSLAAMPDAHRSLEIFPSRESAVLIGREYLRLFPQEAHAERLLDLIVSPAARWAIPSSGRIQPAMAQWLYEKQRGDFVQGQTVLIQGWMLSRTEARLCALLSLV